MNYQFDLDICTCCSPKPNKIKYLSLRTGSTSGLSGSSSHWSWKTVASDLAITPEYKEKAVELMTEVLFRRHNHWWHDLDLEKLQNLAERHGLPWELMTKTALERFNNLQLTLASEIGTL